MKIETIIVGILEVNCYLVWETSSKASFIIDPGDDADKIVARVEDLGLRPEGILLTHGHVDHILAVPALSRRYGIPVLLHPVEHELYFSPRNELPPWLHAADNLPTPGEAPRNLEGLVYDVYHTPGHTRGGCCYHFSADKVIFTGDTLFRGGIGRTDFAGGDHDQLLSSIHDQLLPLPPQTKVYPGHGPQTTVGAEKSGNPFL